MPHKAFYSLQRQMYTRRRALAVLAAPTLAAGCLEDEEDSVDFEPEDAFSVVRGFYAALENGDPEGAKSYVWEDSIYIGGREIQNMVEDIEANSWAYEFDSLELAYTPEESEGSKPRAGVDAQITRVVPDGENVTFGVLYHIPHYKDGGWLINQIDYDERIH